MDGEGWAFTNKKPSCTLDTVNGCSRVREIYLKANPDYDKRITVPVLWDKQKKTIVSNESSEIIRMLNSEFNDYCTTAEQRKLNLYPESLQKSIDGVNEWIYPMINNGVYKSGFATSQQAYDVAVRELFKGLDRVEDILSKTRYLTGSELTEADIRLFTTLIRFDKVYVGHFKCNKKRIVDYPNLWGYLRDVYQIPGVADTVNFEHITKHYMEREGQMKFEPLTLDKTPPLLEGLDIDDLVSYEGKEGRVGSEEAEEALPEVYFALLRIAAGQVKSPFHMAFLRGQRNYRHGYGMGELTFEVYHQLKAWLMKTFVKDSGKNLFTRWPTVRGASKELIKLFEQSSTDGEDYVDNVLYKEMITRIVMKHKELTWTEAKALCQETETNAGLLNTMKLARKIR